MSMLAGLDWVAIGQGLSMGAGALQLITGISSAVQGAQAGEAQAKYAQMVAQREAVAQKEEDRFLAARARVSQYRGVSTTSGSPLLDDLTNARNIRQRFQDRIFQGQVAAYESRLQGRGAMWSGVASAAGGLSTIATAVYRARQSYPSSSLLPNP